MYNVKLYTTSADYVYQQLRHRIITKQLRPGQRLPEVALASQFEVSRTPVREALRRLASEGLVLLIPNSGARVSSPTRSEIEDAYAVREYLESLAVKLAVNTISESQLGRIDDAVAAEEKAFAERNLETYIENNNLFHIVIAEASRNAILAEYVNNIVARTNVYIVFYDPFYDIETNDSIAEHRALAGALRRRAADEAVELMRQHIRLSLGALSKPE